MVLRAAIPPQPITPHLIFLLMVVCSAGPAFVLVLAVVLVLDSWASFDYEDEDDDEEETSLGRYADF